MKRRVFQTVKFFYVRVNTRYFCISVSATIFYSNIRVVLLIRVVAGTVQIIENFRLLL